MMTFGVQTTPYRNLPLSISFANAATDASDPTNISRGIRGPYATMPL